MRRTGMAAMTLVSAGVIAWGVVAYRSASNRAGVPDGELGLRKTALGDDPVPAAVVFAGEAPGNNKPLPRSYDGAPPLIPHSLDGVVPITREENFCLLCHASGSTDPADPPQVPRSHLIDWRAAPGVVRAQVAGARWVCTACHVAQSSAPVLVQNTFGSSGR